MELLYKAVADNGLVAAFAVVGILLWISGVVSRHIFRGRIQGSAIAILGALALAYLGGALTGKAKGLSDVTGFAGLALMGGTMMRDFCIVATASEVRVSEAKKAGGLGLLALLLGTVLPFFVGVGVARAYGYTDPVSLVMIFTPALARFMRLDNPQSAMVFGGLAGTVSGVSAGLAATDRRLVPYGALVATFHTGLGCLMGPSVLFLIVKALYG